MNDRPKAFELATPKSPEEIAREEVRGTMPKARRECSRDPRLKRHVGAKWLFAQLADDSFMHNFGGDGFGKIFTTLRDLQRRYGHDSATLSGWLALLEEAGWVWVRRSWPTWCIGIASISRQPDLFVPEFVRVQARASGQNPPTASGQFAPEEDELARNGHNSGETHEHRPPVANSEMASGQKTNGHSPIHQPPLTTGKRGDRPFHQPPVANGATASGQNTNGHSPTPPTVTDGRYKESPKEKRSSGANGGGETPPPDAKFEAWKLEMSRLFPDKREPHRKRIEAQMGRADSDDYRLWCKVRLEFLNELSMGGKPPRASAPKQKPAKAEAAEPLTVEQVIAHVTWCREKKKPHLITDAHRTIARANGVKL